MQYLLLIYDQESRWIKFTLTQQTAETEAFMAFGKEFTGAISGRPCAPAKPTAKSVCVRDDHSLVTSAETKQALGGYYLIEATDAGEAAKIAAKLSSRVHRAWPVVTIPEAVVDFRNLKRRFSARTSKGECK